MPRGIRGTCKPIVMTGVRVDYKKELSKMYPRNTNKRNTSFNEILGLVLEEIKRYRILKTAIVERKKSL